MCKMKVRRAVNQQYQSVADKAAKSAFGFRAPPEGWIRTVRKALGMTTSQLATRMGVTRDRIFKLEQTEPSGSPTIKSMRAAAEAMGCQFIYAIVPPNNIEGLIMEQARKRATAVVTIANRHMALEMQTLPNEKIEQEITRLTRDFVHEMPSDLWESK